LKPLRILLSAFACKSDQGSESAVGWNWAVELARMGHDVTVITRPFNRESIEKGLLTANLSNLHFYYWDLPFWMQRYRISMGAAHLYHRLWQVGAYCWTRSRLRGHPFDLAQHITYGTLRDPSLMGLLGVPFIFGPVGGGETTPAPLRRSLTLRGRLLEAVRDLSNCLISFDPLLRITLASAKLIVVTTNETKDLLPRKYRCKVVVQQAIGINPTLIIRGTPKRCGEKLRVLFVARLIPWKAGHLVIRTVAEVLRTCPDLTLSIRGDGPESERLRTLAEKLGIAEAVHWVGRVSPEGMMGMYADHDVFLFPSLHDSGGLAVLEAMSQGLPVVCLDLGGPGAIVNENCGRVISTRGANERTVIDKLASALSELALSPDLLAQLRMGALQEAQRYSWKRIVAQLYTGIDEDNGDGTGRHSQSGQLLQG
jgi:glycosyltransferase involved in cell wall biosynthesis